MGSELSGYSIPNDYFFECYFETLNYHNLILGDFGFELETINKRNVIPMFIKSLTHNGLAFIEYIRKKEYTIHDRIYINGGFDLSYIFIDE